MTHVLYPIFQEKLIGNVLRYVRGLQVLLIDVDNVDLAESHKWVRLISKNTYDTCLISNFFKRNQLGMVWDMCFFSNMRYPLVGLGLVDVVDVDEHDLEASNTSETVPNRFLLKNWILNMYHMCFLKYDVPTCGTRPGRRCRRRWAWLGGLWLIWDHSKSISLEKLDINHLSYVFFKIWRTHLWDSTRLTLSTSMSMTLRPLTYLRPFSIDFSWKIG